MYNGDEPTFIRAFAQSSSRSDNRLENLRAVTSSDNKSNESLRIDSTSGFIGVTWYTPTSRPKRQNGWLKIAKGTNEKHNGYYI
jgi:hypothetical protein